MNPYILTLDLDPDLHRRLTSWRSRFFPPERNYLDAHVTMFHALPAEHLRRVITDLEATTRARSKFVVQAARVYSLGRGVAVDVTAAEIHAVRTELHAGWFEFLGSQDRAPNIRPHATLQNKVGGDVAKRALTEIAATWDPATRGVAQGLSLWEYLGGPWRKHAGFEFNDSPETTSFAGRD